MDAEETIQKAEQNKNKVRNLSIAAIDVFLEREGEMTLVDECHPLDDNINNIDVISHLVSDEVDPVQIVRIDGESYVGVIDFWEGDGVYGYEQYDDVLGVGKKVVCARCVQTKQHAFRAGRVREHDTDYDTYEELAELIHEKHYQKHDVEPENVEIEIGASLASGTTINANTAIHGGNQGSFNVDSFSGSGGTSGQFLQTDGSSLSFAAAGGDLGDVPIYGDGASGSVTDSSDKNRSGVLRATDYTLEAGNTVTVLDSEGVLVILASQSITINGTIDASGAGANGGGGGSNDNSGNSASNGLIAPLGSGGSGGSGPEINNLDGGNGGSGDQQSPVTRREELLYTFATLRELHGADAGAGGGGGGGGHDRGIDVAQSDGNPGSAPGGGGSGAVVDEANSGAAAGGDGGDGGGAIVLVAPSITVGGSLLAAGQDGQDGNDSSGAAGGGGGGGTGGLILLKTAELTENSPTYDVSGGAAGQGGTGVFDGGDGAAGASGIKQVIGG